MSRAFGATPHSEIARAFEAENRQHTYVEQLSSGEFTKKYQLRLSLEELLTLLDQLAGFHPEHGLRPHFKPGLASRQLRAKILATLGLVEEG